MFRDYVALLPRYRGVPDLRGVALQRAFFGFVPNWCGSGAAAAAPGPATLAHHPVHVFWIAACLSLPSAGHLRSPANKRSCLLALVPPAVPRCRGVGACRYDSPLQPVTARLIHVGDSAGNRSALSFAGAGRARAWPWFFSSFLSSFTGFISFKCGTVVVCGKHCRSPSLPGRHY
jgi:hypothetical protein